MSVEEQIRSEMRTVGLTVEPDTDLALAQVESGVHRQRTSRAILATAAAVAAVAGVVWAAGSWGWLTGQGDVQPVEQPVDPPVKQQIDSDGGWVLWRSNWKHYAGLGDAGPHGAESAGLHDVHFLTAIADHDGRLVAVGAGTTPIVTSTNAVDWTPASTPDAWLNGVVPGGPGLIAYGHSDWPYEADDHHAVVWTSPDGLTWTPVEDHEGDFDVPYSDINAITVGGPGFVAIGTSDNKPAVWTSPDGLDWTTPQLLASESGSLRTVTHSATGLTVRGWVDDASPPEYRRNAAWTSIDGGNTWSRARHDPVLGELSRDESVEHVITAGPGLVAIGSDGATDQVLVWNSADGEAWTQVSQEEHGLDGSVSRVISTGAAFVAVGATPGNDLTIDAAVWTSVDGITWEPGMDESFGGRYGQSMADVIETDTGLVAVGVTGLDQTAVANWSAAVWLMERS